MSKEDRTVQCAHCGLIYNINTQEHICHIPSKKIKLKDAAVTALAEALRLLRDIYVELRTLNEQQVRLFETFMQYSEIKVEKDSTLPPLNPGYAASMMNEADADEKKKVEDSLNE